MNWITIAWPMAAAVCVTLGLIELRIGIARPRDLARLLFALNAFTVASVCAFEIAMMRAQTEAQFDLFLRCLDIAVGVMIASLVAFIWVYFRSGAKWLALAAPCIYAVALLADFMPGQSLGYLTITELATVETFGNASYRVAKGVPNPWNVITYVAVLVLLVFVVDSSIRLWRLGGRRRAAVVGGAVAVWIIAGGVHAALIESGLLQMPYLISVTYLVVLLAMTSELTSDVAAASRLARELRESEQRMDLASAAAGLGIWTWDPKGNDIWASEQARTLYGLREQQPLNLALLADAVHVEDRHRVRLALDNALATNHDFDVEHRVLLPDGSLRWIAARGRAERGADGRPVLMRGVVLDISARRNSELELQRLREQITHASRVSMLGQLASALAHELNQPLGAILRNAEAAELFLQHTPPQLGELRPILADIRADDQRARDVIERLRMLLKRRSIESRPVELVGLLRNSVALTRADASVRRIALELQLEEGLPIVMGDAVHLQQVMLNLVLNSMDAIDGAPHEHRRVVIRTRKVGARAIEVAVCDRGRGIPGERLKQIFEPFFTTKPNGMGIGLSISRTIIEAHGGRIWAESSATDGTTFRFSLPTREVS